MIFPKNKKHLFTDSFYLNNDNIEIVENFTYLGYPLDNNLNYNLAIEHVNKKICSTNSILARMRPYFSTYYLNLIYNSLGLSYIIYFKSMIFCCSENQTKQLRNSLRHTSSILNNTTFGHYLNCDMEFYFTIHYYLTQYIYKVTKNNFCPPLKIFQIAPHHYNTRNNNCYYILQPNCNVFNKSFSSFAPKLMNKINIHNIENLNQLQKILKDNKIRK